MAVRLLACALLGRSAAGSGAWLEEQNATAAGRVQSGASSFVGGYCALNDLVNCTYGSATCSGNQCCPRAPGGGLNKTYPCPSAAPDFVDCEVQEKAGDCLDPFIAKSTVSSGRAGVLDGAMPAATPPPEPSASTSVTTPAVSQTNPVTATAASETTPVTTTAVSETKPVTTTTVSEAKPVTTTAASKTEPVTTTTVSETNPVTTTPASEMEPVMTTAASEMEPVTTTTVSETKPAMRGGVDKNRDITTATQTATSPESMASWMEPLTSGTRSQLLLTWAIAAPLLLALVVV